jgi:hypothetical protein
MAGKTVNVKLYSEDAGLLDISSHPADYYLVLTGPKPVATSSVRSLPRRIDAVYLFDIGACVRTFKPAGSALVSRRACESSTGSRRSSIRPTTMRLLR